MDRKMFDQLLCNAQIQLESLQPIRETLLPEQQILLSESITELTGTIAELQRSGHEAAAQQNEERYHSLFDNKHTVMLLIDPGTGQIVDANPAAVAFYGAVREDLLKLKISEINVLPDDLVKEEMEKARQEQRIYFNFKHRLANGDVRDVEVYSGPILFDDRQLLYSVIHDNTERKKAEEALRISEDRYRVLFEDAIEGIVQTSPDGRYLNVNQSYVRMLGYDSPQDLVQSVTDVASQIYAYPEDRARLFGLLAASDRVENFEGQAVRKDGEKIWVSMNVNAVRDQKGKLVRIDSRLMDITLRKQTEASLRANEERLHLATFSGNIGIWDWDIASDVLTWDDSMYALYGIRKEEYAGPFDAWIKTLHPEDLEATREAMQAAVRGEGEFGSEFRIVRPDRTVRIIQASSRTFRDRDGAALRMIGTNLDITDRKRAEEELFESRRMLQLVLDTIPQRVFWKDCNFIYLGCNQAFAKDAGFANSSEVVGLDDFSLVWKMNAPSYRADDQEVMQRGVPKLDFEEKQGRPDGSQNWVKTNKVPFYDRNNKIIGLLGTYEDITDRKLAEEQLQLSNEKLIVMVSGLEQRNYEANLVHELDDLLQACNQPEEAYMAVQQFGHLLFPATSGALFITKNSPNTVEAVTIWGKDLQSELAFRPEDCWGLRLGKAQYWSSLTPGLRCNHVLPSFSGDYLGIPMVAANELLGLLHIESTDHHLISQELSELAKTITERLSLTLTNIQLREKLRAESIRDPLTGLFNRRFMEEYLDKELNRAVRKQSTVGVIMLDIDHFKNFNDSYGHPGGDAVLRELGALLLTKIRGGDIACRFGGEEFILILPETSFEIARQRAEQIREAVQGMQIEFRQKPLGTVSVSAGVAIFPDHGADPLDLLNLADQALYKAKHKGRNRVEIAE